MQAEIIVEATGGAAERSHVIKLAQRFLLGRGHDVTIRVHDDVVSRHHAEFELHADGWLSITDLGSRNGTFLSGTRLPPNTPTPVTPGARITAGGVTLRVEMESAQFAVPQAAGEGQPGLPPEEFQVLGLIGRGAVGSVYAATQRLLGRRVAVKVLREDGADSRERLQVEGQTASRIRSPYVVQVHDIRSGRNGLCLIMELINGPSVMDRLRAGRLPLAEALRIGEQVALGLAAAHEVGVVHRDVKPGNILMAPEGAAKLTDFGIAKDLLSKDRMLTDSNLGLGSLPYISPEQVIGAKHVGPSADLYSLGATLYHMIAGEPPFQAKSPNILMHVAESPPPPLSKARPDCPPDVARLVHALLEKDPAARPTNANSVARQLHELRELHVPDTVEASPDAPDTRKSRMREWGKTRDG